MFACRAGKMQQLLPDQIIESGFFAVSGMDRERRVTLFAPDVFVFHHVDPVSLSSTEAQDPTPDYVVVSHSSSLDQRRRPETFLTAIATAFFWPTSTTSFFPRVTPV